MGLKSFWLLAVLSLGMIFVVSGLVVAQPALDQVSGDDFNGLQLTPAIFEVVIEPGKQKSKSLKLTNITEDYLPIRVVARSFVPYDEEIDSSQRERFDAASWLSLSEDSFILKPGQDKLVPTIIDVPAEAEPGGHYATIVFEPLIEQRDNQTDTASNVASVAALAFVTVPGDIAEYLSVSSWEMGLFSNSQLVNIGLKLSNQGNIHQLPRVSFQIHNWRSKPVELLSTPPRFILPNTNREFSNPWRAPGKIGIYKIGAMIEFGTPTQKIEVEPRWVIVAPWKLLLTLLVAIGAISVFVKRTYRRWPRAWRALRRRHKNS